MESFGLGFHWFTFENGTRNRDERFETFNVSPKRTTHFLICLYSSISPHFHSLSIFSSEYLQIHYFVYYCFTPLPISKRYICCILKWFNFCLDNFSFLFLAFGYSFPLPVPRSPFWGGLRRNYRDMWSLIGDSKSLRINHKIIFVFPSRTPVGCDFSLLKLLIHNSTRRTREEQLICIQNRVACRLIP